MAAIPRSEWTNWFNQMSKLLLGKRVEIEVASLELGSQIGAEWVPVIGITYDHNDDALDVALANVHHRIQRPREIMAEAGPAGLSSVLVVDAEGVRQILKFKDPLALPPAIAAT